MISDVQALIAKSTANEHRVQTLLSSFDYTKYHPMQEVRICIFVNPIIAGLCGIEFPF